MKYSEATELIKGLSKKYSIIDDDRSVFELIYKNKLIARVDKKKQFIFRVVDASGFDELPHSHKLWILLAELAMTPLNERKEHHWNVIVGNDSSRSKSIVCWVKSDEVLPYRLCLSDSISLANDKYTIFTDDEFNDLIKYIKTLPDGEWQAKVAEHGKTLVKGE